MRSLLILLSVVSLSAAVGCGASSRAARTATPANATVAESDQAWTPPGEMDVSYGDAREGQARQQTATTTMKPNRREIPRGQVHAAY